MRALLLVLFVAGAALTPRAQDAAHALVGTWSVARLADPGAPPQDDLAAALPALTHVPAPVRVAFAGDGAGTVWLLVPLVDGYEVRAEPLRWQATPDHLTVGLEDQQAVFALTAADGGWRVTSDEGVTLHLRRD